MNSLTENRPLASLLEELHQASDDQTPAITGYLGCGDERRPTGFEPDGDSGRQFWHDKLVAIDRDKALAVYQIARATGARRILEAGTSHGVSTLYVAAAVHDNGGGSVDTYEIEPHKAEIAAGNLERAGLSGHAKIHVGEILENLTSLDGDVDLLLLDIWAPIAGRVLALAAQHLRPGSVIIADNTTSRASLYGDLFSQLRADDGVYSSITLPYDGGLEFAIKK